MTGQPELDLMARLESLLNNTLQKQAEDAQLISGLSALMLGEEVTETEPAQKTQAPAAVEASVKEAEKPAEKPIKKQASIAGMSVRECLMNEHAQRGFLDTVARRGIELELALEKCAQAYIDAYAKAKETSK